MIIPDDHNQDTPKPVDKSSRVLDVPVAYQNKVNTMLDKLPVGKRVRIGRVCKVETQPKFIQAVKNYICTHDNGVLFSNDYTHFFKSEPWTETKHETPTQTPMNREAVATRNSLIRWFRIRLKGDPIEPFTIVPATFNDPAGFIESMIGQTKHNTIGSSPFRAAINHLQTIKKHLES